MSLARRFAGACFRPLNLWIVGTAIWLLVSAIADPQFGATDIFVYKDAGVNWALGRGLVTAGVPGNVTLDPTFYSSYPPVFPLVYGLFVRMFGLGAYQNTFFNLSVAALSCGAWMLLLGRMFPRRSGSAGLGTMNILLVLMIPTGTLTVATDRPDQLAFLVFLLSFLISVGTDSPKRMALAFFLAGLNASISPFAGIMNFVCLCAVQWSQLVSAKRRLAICLLLAMIPTAATVAFFWWADPEAISRLWKYGTGRGGVGQNVISGEGLRVYLTGLKHAAFSSGVHSVGLFLSFLGMLVLLCGYAAKCAGELRSPAIRFLLAAGGLGLFTLAAFPARNNYMGLARNAALVLFLVLFLRVDKNPRSAMRVSVAAVILLALGQVPEMARDTAARLVTRSSYSRAQAQCTALAKDLQKTWPMIEPISGVVSPSLYFVFKPHFNIFDPSYFQFDAWHGRIQFAATSFVGTGDPFQSFTPSWIQEHGWTIISQPRLPQIARIGCIPVSRSSCTWESRVYRAPATNF
jgi:hypothetical protein